MHSRRLGCILMTVSLQLPEQYSLVHTAFLLGSMLALEHFTWLPFS